MTTDPLHSHRSCGLSPGNATDDSTDQRLLAGTDRAARPVAVILVAVLCACFAVALLPYAATFLVHHPDERHYRDGAIFMLRTGDYWTPRAPDGAPRLHKPALTYWLVALGYRVFGINVLGSRIAFLVVSTVTIVLTYRLGVRVGGNRATGVTAAAIVGSNWLVMSLATRSIPESPLCLSLVASTYGMAGILLGRRPVAGHLAWFYVGAGLAIATKGAPGGLFLAYALLFALANPWKRVAWRELWHGPSIGVGATIAIAWFFVMAGEHGRESLGQFARDQIGTRVDHRWWRPALKFPELLVLVTCSLLPWGLLVLRRGLGSRPNHPRRLPGGTSGGDRACWMFFLGWSVLLVFAASLTRDATVRYALSAVPLLAVLCARIVVSLPADRLRADVVWLVRFVAISLLAWVVVAVAVSYQFAFEAPVLATALAVGVVAVVVARNVSRLPVQVAICGASTLLMLVMPTTFCLLRPLLLPDQSEKIARVLGELGLERKGAVVGGDRGGAAVGPMDASQEPIQLVSRPALASKLRVMLAGQRWIRSAQRDQVTEDDLRCAVVVVAAEDAEGFALPGFATRSIPHGFRELDVAGVLAAFWSGTLPEYLDTHTQQIVIAARPSVFAKTGEERVVGSPSSTTRK